MAYKVQDLHKLRVDFCLGQIFVSECFFVMDRLYSN